jgi:hypothetical protein
MGIVKAINQSFLDKERKGFDKTYYFFDIHGTILKPNYKAGDIPKEFYPYAKEVLKFITGISDIVMCLYTCSHTHEVKEYLEFFKNEGIVFTYINENPEVVTDLNGYGCYDTKPYMNVLFEDKSGFDSETEWEEVLVFMKEKYGSGYPIM